MKRIFNSGAFFVFLSVIGPGLITSLADNDAGGITTYSIAGAHFGYSMLWSLIPITIALVFIQEMCARMGVVTGKGLADLIRESFGLKITFFVMIGLLFANFFTTMSEFAGIAASGEIFGMSKYVIVPLSAALIFLLILKSNYKSLERVFFILSIFYVSYILSGFFAKPDWGLVAKETFAPTIKLTTGYIIILIGVIGTTITPWMQFYLQSSIVEKGIRLEEYKYTRLEVIISSILTSLVSFFIIVAAASTLFVNKIRINDAADAAVALAPLVGNFAQSLFALGLFAAAFFGAFIIPLATAFYICEALGWESGVNKKFKDAKQFYVLLFLIISIAMAIVLIPNIPLVKLMVASQVINGILLPIVLISMLLIINNEKIMGKYKNSASYNIVVWAASIIIILLTLLMVATTLFPGILG
ncbi:Nramp family divalent metal transporter [Candidatus Woesearchaeota archaeon]|nr:Nramp family divalent metal transporter [Candidatus Woesearchaeota archaeon]